MAISGPQVNCHYRFFIMCDRPFWYNPKLMYKKFVSFYNPEIIEVTDEKILAWEGCISNEEEVVLVERPKGIKARFLNFKGVQIDLVCDGLMSRIF